MNNSLAYVGIGIYTIPEAARIIHVNPRTLRNWVLGYTYHTKLRQVTQRPVVPRLVDFDMPVLSFVEMVELLFVKLFRMEGVSLQTIRRATIAASGMFGTAYPLATRKFDTDGKRIFSTLEGLQKDPKLVEDLGKGAFAFDVFVRPFFRHLDYRGEAEAIRYWPEEGGRRIVLDPERSFGQPIDSVTGVPSRVLFQAYRASGAKEFSIPASWYNVPTESVLYAVRYEETLEAAA